jgi:hypothetical protein
MTSGTKTLTGACASRPTTTTPMMKSILSSGQSPNSDVRVAEIADPQRRAAGRVRFDDDTSAIVAEAGRCMRLNSRS